MRIYDPRLGRFLSVDPIGKKFPFYTPYQFAGNKPIIAIDLDGLEDRVVVKQAFFEKIEYSIYENSDNTKISVVNFNTKSKELAVDLDGADVYHPNDIGLDANSNGGINYDSETKQISGKMYGVAVDKKGEPIIQSAEQRSPGYYVSQTSVTVNGFTDNQPERYIDAISIPYLAVSQEFLDATGAQWGDLGVATNKANDKSVFFIIGDKKSSMKNIEMSHKMLEQLNIPMVYTGQESYDGKMSSKKVKSVKTTTKQGDAIYDVNITIFRNSTTLDNGKKSGANKGLNSRNLIDGLAKFYRSLLNKADKQ